MRNKKNILKVVLLFVIGAVFIIFSIKVIGNILNISSYFRIKNKENVVIRGPRDIFDEKEILDTGVFSIDLKGLAKKIKASYPFIHQVRIYLHLPDEVVIDIEQRVPLAKIRHKGYCYLIDKDGIILPSARYGIKEELPTIIGLDRGISRPHEGEVYDTAGVELALSLLSEIESDPDLLGSYRITVVDVSKENEISFFINPDVEIRIGGSNFKERLRLLNLMLSELKSGLDQTKYIDLRFKDPVVGSR